MDSFLSLLGDDDELPPIRQPKKLTAAFDALLDDEDLFHLTNTNKPFKPRSESRTISNSSFGDLLVDDDFFVPKINPTILEDNWDGFSAAETFLTTSSTLSSQKSQSTLDACVTSDDMLFSPMVPVSATEIEIECNRAIRTSDDALKLKAMSQDFLVLKDHSSANVK
jgi:hypothetical protein